MLAGVRRYTLLATPLMLVVVPIFFWLMPDLIRLVFGERYLDATDAARLILVAAGIQLAIGWTKSLPVSIGRPNLRLVTHGIETAVLLPLVVVLGARVGRDRRGRGDARRDGRLRARLGGRLRRRAASGAGPGRPGMRVLIVSGIWPPDVGGPASHSPELAARLHARGHRVEVLTTAAAAPTPSRIRCTGSAAGLPPGLRHAQLRAAAGAARASADVVYVNSVLTRGELGVARSRGDPSSSS